MNADIESKIHREITRRIIKRAALVQKEKEALSDSQCTLEALQELTGLPAAEIEKIASEVRASFLLKKRDFFSIKNQILLAALFGASFIVLVFLIVWIF